MHPTFTARLHAARHGRGWRRFGGHPGFGQSAGFGEAWEAFGRHGGGHGGHGAGRHGPGGRGGGGGGFGVRRPLRFLAWKLELDDDQLAELAAILDDLKTERAQAEVDDHRALKALSESLGADPFDRERAEAAANGRTESTARVQRAVIEALARIHALLSPEQRSRLALLIRSGYLTL